MKIYTDQNLDGRFGTTAPTLRRQTLRVFPLSARGRARPEELGRKER